MTSNRQTVFEFIVAGSGIAGLHTALTLAPFGSVLIITKKKLSSSSTYYAQGGIAAVTNKDDSVISHTNDTMSAGYYYNKKKAVNVLVNGGGEAIANLVKFGVPFDREKNKNFLTSYEAAHSYPRILHATDFTGREIEKALISAAKKNSAITLWEDTTAIDLLVSDNECVGIVVLKNNMLLNLFSRGVVIATGGVGQLYQWTTNPDVSTGDGLAIANRAGADLSDLEFMQFHPTAFAENVSPLLLISEALRGEGAVLKNAKGDRFMQKIHPLAELAPRDVVTRAIFHEQKKGAVYLDIRHKNKSQIRKRFPNIMRELQKRGISITDDLIPVTPAAHFMCGGIVTNLYGRTSIKGLFAYGEVALTGVHGANRLASNSLLEGMVFSNQIKYCVSALPKKANKYPFSKPQLFTNTTRIDINRHIQKIMWEYVGIVRSPWGLDTALNKLHLLEKEIGLIKGINDSLIETRNMLTVALLITNAAKKRNESLGTHYMKK